MTEYIARAAQVAGFSRREYPAPFRMVRFARVVKSTTNYRCAIEADAYKTFRESRVSLCESRMIKAVPAEERSNEIHALCIGTSLALPLLTRSFCGR